MNDEIWFEEPLLPPRETADETASYLAALKPEDLAREKSLDLAALEKTAVRGRSHYFKRFTREKAQGIVRVHRPAALALASGQTVHFPGAAAPSTAAGFARGPLFLVKLGLEFAVTSESRDAGWNYAAAWCRTSLSAAGSVQPLVLEVYPERLYEGAPAEVEVKAGPEIKAGAIEGQLASVGAKWRAGQVTPVTLGFLGDEQRKPYWELREKDTPILGIYHFWLLVERPPGCESIRLNLFGEGDLRTRLFTIPVGPKVRQWTDRREREIDIQELLL